MNKELYWKYSLMLIILLMGYAVFRGMAPFLGGLLGALTLYILLRRQMAYLTERRNMRRGLAALLLTAETVLCFMLPLALTVWLLIGKLQAVNLNPQSIVSPVRQVVRIVHEQTGYNLLSENTLTTVVSALPQIGQRLMSGISSLAINLMVMIFVLYFMLTGGRRMEAYFHSVLPFNAANTQEVMQKVHLIVRSNAIGIPLLALIQGGVAMAGYLIFGMPNAWLLGILTGFSSIIPLVGTIVVWIPVVLYFMAEENWVSAIGMLLYGAIVISQCDNLIRFVLQKQMADIHPLITVFGVIIGLPLFGFMGVIFGPLLLSLFLLLVDMFKEEYLS